jgi:YHS domain-containing protein
MTSITSQKGVGVTRSVQHTMCAAAILLFATVVPAFAGEYFEKDGAAIGGYHPVAYFFEMKPVKGLPEFQSEYQGSIFYFSSATNRATFTASPDKFAPQYGGYCAFGTAKGYKAVIDPAAFTLVEDKLYLNYSEGVRSRWQSDIPGYIRKANANWQEVRKLTKVQE